MLVLRLQSYFYFSDISKMAKNKVKKIVKAFCGVLIDDFRKSSLFFS